MPHYGCHAHARHDSARIRVPASSRSFNVGKWVVDGEAITGVELVATSAARETQNALAELNERHDQDF